MLTKRYVSSGAEDYVKRFNEAAFQAFADPEKNKPLKVGLTDYMGGDGTVIRAATVGHGLDIFPERFSDEAFFHHLVASGIEKPFRTVQLKFLFTQMPINTALQFVYDPACSVNEISGRYSVLSDKQETVNNELLMNVSKLSRAQYESFLEQHELARELARTILGTNTHTSFVWKMNLFELARFVTHQRKFLKLNNLAHDFINKIESIASVTAPYSWSALMNPGKKLSLTYPRDEAIVDPELSPALWSPQETEREVVTAMEDDLFHSYHFLDHGRFQTVDYLGSDQAVVSAARISYGQGTIKKRESAALLRYLIRNAHTSPLEMAVIAVEEKNPFFSDPRQVGRHRTAAWGSFMDEVQLGSQFYLPSKDQLRQQDTTNRQGRAELYSDEVASDILKAMQAISETQKDIVNNLSPEISRLAKGVGFYTRTWRTFDANNNSRFLALRLDEHAQWEVRQYAQQVFNAFRLHTPVIAQAFVDYTLETMRFSRLEREAIVNSRVLEGNVLDESSLVNLSEREKTELKKKLGLLKP